MSLRKKTITENLITTIQTYITKQNLLTTGKPVIVGFSGGSDSVALLFILKQLGYQCITAHCNFHLRDDESDRDEASCRLFAEQQAVTFEKIDFDTKSYAAQHHLSIEMAARELRYKWLEEIRKKFDAQAIAIAHHRGDSIETLLINLIRGTGIRGLTGIRPKNGFIVRPLLCIGQDDITQFIKENNLSFVTDSSNLSDDFMRNKIRLRLLPMMKELNPSIELAMARTAEQLADAETVYIQAIEDARKIVTTKASDGVLKISIPHLKGLPASKTILYELLRPYGFTRQLSENIYYSLSGVSGKIFKTLDSGYQLLKDRDTLLIYQSAAESPENYQIRKNETSFEIPAFRLSIQQVDVSPTLIIDKSPATVAFDYDKLIFPLTLRKWQTGDWFIPFGMKGRKKLSDYFSDHKFSILQKSKIWLLCSGEDIIWIIGERIDNRFRLGVRSKKALLINFFSNNTCI